MAKAKKSGGKSKSSVKVQDLRSKKNPKGGAADIFAKLGDIKGESLSANKLSTTTFNTSALNNSIYKK